MVCWSVGQLVLAPLVHTIYISILNELYLLYLTLNYYQTNSAVNLLSPTFYTYLKSSVSNDSIADHFSICVLSFSGHIYVQRTPSKTRKLSPQEILYSGKRCVNIVMEILPQLKWGSNKIGKHHSWRMATRSEHRNGQPAKK